MNKDPLPQFAEKQIQDALNGMSDAGRYKRLMDLFRKVDVSANGEFQKLYEEFYMLKRRKQSFRTAYFKYMQDQKGRAASLQFRNVLEYLYRKNKTVEASFAAKLLHTVNPKLPTWDKWIGQHTGIKIPVYKANQMEKAVAQYERLVTWFADYQKSKNGKALVAAFDKSFPGCKDISVTKKIDLVLWQMR